MGSFVFISYSREDLSFSESIALSLIEQGQAVWFDLLALMPGMDWRSSIRDGIQESAGIAVVMSPSAAKSPNVADEVRQAIAAGKPLFLAAVEATPLRLEHAPEIDMASVAHSIVDMRDEFQSALRRLVSCCKSGQRIEDSVSLRRLATPPFPRHITELAIASCLFFASLAYVWAAWFTAAGFPWKLSAGRLNFAA